MPSTLILKNTTASSLGYSFGTIGANSSEDYTGTAFYNFNSSTALLADIRAGDIVVNNGSYDLSASDGVAYLQGRLKNLELTSYVFEHTLIKNDTWLGTATLIGENAGYTTPLDGEIRMMTARGLDCNADIDFSIYINDVEHADVLNLAYTDNAAHQNTNHSVGIDFSSGDLIRVRSRRNSGVEILDITVTLYIKWRQ